MEFSPSCTAPRACSLLQMIFEGGTLIGPPVLVHLTNRVRYGIVHYPLSNWVVCTVILRTANKLPILQRIIAPRARGDPGGPWGRVLRLPRVMPHTTRGATATPRGGNAATTTTNTRSPSIPSSSSCRTMSSTISFNSYSIHFVFFAQLIIF